MMNSTQGPQRRTFSWCFAILVLLCGCVCSWRASATSPILILTNASDAFSQYYEQIIQTEGLNEYALGNVTSVTNGILGPYDVALLAPTALTPAQATSISNWVSGGGKLIAVRPDKQLAGLLGLVDAGTTISEGYLLINTNTAPGAGLINQTLQFHGTADAYTLGGASSLATLYSDAVTPTVYPAVTVQNVGVSGGQAAAITFDLARSITLTRQGNPAWVDQFRDGLSPTRPDDLFYGPASFDPQPNYVDFNKIAIPQADEQQRLLANMMINMNAAKRLLPRFWYFPHGYRAVVMMGGDDHANGGTASRFDQYLAYSPTNGTVADWTAIRSTSYIFAEPTLLSNSEAAAYNALGFEIGLHLNTGCSTYNFSSLDSFFTNQLSGFTNTYPSLPVPVTQRIHCIAWSGYTIAPQDELLHGERLDATYYYYPTNWVADQPGLMTGSAMPMRYVTTNGNLIDVFQAAVPMTDESGQTYPKNINALLDGALGPQQYYGSYVANMHTDFANNPESDLIVMAAVNRGVPIVSSRQMLTWLDARNASSLSSINWTNNTLSFSVSAAANSTGLQVMVPIPAALSVSNVTYNGGATGYFLRGVNGMQYAFINGLSGSYTVTFQADTVSPTVVSVVPANGATAVAQSASVSVAFSEALSQATVNTNTISLLNATNGVVPATVSYNPATFTAVLTPNSPLALASSYSIRVNGGGSGVADVTGNGLVANFTSSFSTIPQIDYSIWTNGTEPAVASVEETNSIEVGLKFRSMVNGYISGVRFFKGCFNKGTHIGNLWTTNGVLLASATYTNETFAGWQSQALAAPLVISSNTTYVVSCFEPVGGYSSDVGYFAGSDYTNYPLYALADGENGGNGLFAYGATSTFPNQSFQSENFWVDVVFHPGTAPLTVTTMSLSNGVMNLAYTATLTATGGTNPYTWSIVSGSLPPGLTLNTNSGVISGAPGNIGTFNFTVQVTDSSQPMQTATQGLSITINSLPTGATIWSSNAAPVTADGGADSPVELGVKFRSDVPGYITGIRFYKSSANIGTHFGDLWTTNGTLLATATFSGESASGWQQVNLGSPVAISANTVYVASYHCNNGHYSADNNYFASSGVDNPPLHALADGVSGPDGVYSYGSGSVFPVNGFSADNYWVDVVFSGTLGPLLPVQTNRVVNELTTLVVTNTAVDSSPISYTLTVTNLGTGLAVTNASINTNGVITWTPGQTQSPSTNRFTTVASDGTYNATNSFTVKVREVNVAPVLPNQTNMTINGQTPIVVTNTAGEPNIHSVTVGYGLSGPTGATIDTNGVIRWTPAAGQVPGVYPFTTVVTNNNPYDLVNPQLRATNSFTVTVNAIHNAPVLPVQTNRVMNEQTLLVVTNTASGNDLPPLTLSYTLTVTNLANGNAVLNAAIDTNGVITWMPGQMQSPSTNQFTTVVSDGTYSASNSFLVTVLEVNVAPILPNQTNLTITGQTPIVVTNTASEPNVHSVTAGYQLSGPSGSSIDGNGIIRWTPAAGQVPGVYPFTTVVSNTDPYDLINPQLSATNSFTVTVNAVHNAPVLPNQTNVTVNELTLLVVTNTASENDLPALPLTYNLVVTNLADGSAVTNATIDTNGVISWTPTEAQGPSSNRVVTVVSDGSLSATNSFVVFVNEVNVAPVLPNQTNITVNGETPIVVTNTASDSDIPVNPLGYVVTGPLGASIDGNGIIRWTPTAGQVPGVYLFTTVVTDTNVYAVNAQNLSATNSFTVTVNVVHNPPVLPNQTNVAVNELTLLVVTNTASANDVPALPLSYTLVVTNIGNGQAVTNATIDTNGIISWTPTEAQGPSSNEVVTVVSDGSLSATNSFVVFVNEVNVAPVLPNQTNMTITGETPIVVTNTASDSDIPVEPLGYVLTGPLGATIDGNGIIRWTPAAGQVPGVYLFTTVVTDTNVYAVNAQNLSATNSFTVTVNAVHNAPVLPVQTNRVVNELTLLVVTNTASENDLPALPLSYTLMVTNIGTGQAVTNAAIDTNGVISWTPVQTQSPSTNAFVTVVSDGSLSATNSFLVTVVEVNMAPVLPSQTDMTISGLTPIVVTNTASEQNIHSVTAGYQLNGPSGSSIDADGVIRWTPTLGQVPGMYPFTTVVSNSNPYDVVNPQLTATNSFTVTVQTVNAPQPVIQSVGWTNDVTTVVWTAVPPHVYRLLFTETLPSTNWNAVVPDVTATGSTAATTDTNAVSIERYYKVLVVQ